jgi:ribosomal protein S18 acetylase RimI-like enzyme
VHKKLKPRIGFGAFLLKNKMEYHRIYDPLDPELFFVRELYQQAFPVKERRGWQQLLSLLEKEPDMFLDCIRDEGQTIGFIIWWKMGNWAFIEHFAVSVTKRGKNYGSRVITHYLDAAAADLLLEVEPPDNEDARRRVMFYQRLGMVLLDYDYRQPSYREVGVSYPLRLMSSKTDLDPNTPDFEKLVKSVKAKVYHVQC